MKRQWVKFPWGPLLGKQNIQAKGRTIRKVMGGENFRATGIFFRYQIPCMNIF